MAYKKRVWRFMNAIEVEEYHTARYGAPGERRKKKENPTPEEMEKINRKLREKNCRRKLRANFDVNDYFITLTYTRDQRPADMAEAKKDFTKFVRAVRKEYASQVIPLKWIRNIEVGTKNGWHIHLVMNRIPETDMIVARAWKKGKVHFQLLNEWREFHDLAAYITKTPKTDPRLKESSYSASRNLPVPEPEEKVIIRWETWKGEPKLRKNRAKDWYIDPASVHEGVNKFGYRYRSYTMLRVRRC